MLRQLAYRPANVYQLAQGAYQLRTIETPSTAQLVAVRRAIRRLREDGFLLPPMRPPRTPPGTRDMNERGAADRAETRLRVHRIKAEFARGIREMDRWDPGGPPGRPFPPEDRSE